MEANIRENPGGKETKMQYKSVANEEYLPVLRELLREGKTVSLNISGSSMAPFFVHQRDRVLLSPVTETLKKGDIAIFQRQDGRYVLHRICRVTGDKQYYFIGDAQTEAEGPIQREQIFGIVTAVCRKNRWIRPGDFWWGFFRRVWLRIIPLRRIIIGFYGHFRK